MTRDNVVTSKKQFVPKGFNTEVGTIEQEYGIKLGVEPDTKLGNYLKDKGYPSLSDMLK